LPAIKAAPPLETLASFGDMGAVGELPAIDSRTPASIVRKRKDNLPICHASNPFHCSTPRPKARSGTRQGGNMRRSIHPKG